MIETVTFKNVTILGRKEKERLEVWAEKMELFILNPLGLKGCYFQLGKKLWSKSFASDSFICRDPWFKSPSVFLTIFNSTKTLLLIAWHKRMQKLVCYWSAWRSSPDKDLLLFVWNMSLVYWEQMQNECNAVNSSTKSCADDVEDVVLKPVRMCFPLGTIT